MTELLATNKKYTSHIYANSISELIDDLTDSSDKNGYSSYWWDDEGIIRISDWRTRRTYKIIHALGHEFIAKYNKRHVAASEKMSIIVKAIIEDHSRLSVRYDGITAKSAAKKGEIGPIILQSIKKQVDKEEDFTIELGHAYDNKVEARINYSMNGFAANCRVIVAGSNLELRGSSTIGNSTTCISLADPRIDPHNIGTYIMASVKRSAELDKEAQLQLDTIWGDVFSQ